MASPDTLFCFSSDGTERWRYRPGREISVSNRTFDDVYRISPVKIGRRPDGSRMVVLGSHHRLYYPSHIVVLSATGRTVGDYWHAGYVGTEADRLQVLDLDLDGRVEIYAAGVNNARELATLVVLDPETMGGVGVEDNAKYQFKGFHSGRELARVFFRRSSVSKSDRYNVAYNILIGSSVLTIAVKESLLAPGAPTVFYELDSDLQLRDVSFSDTFVGAYRRLRLDGLLEVDMSWEREALRDIWVIR